MLKFISASAVLAVAAALAHAADIRFFVSPAGSDANPGTLEKPFATIIRARDAVGRFRKDGRAGNVTVFIRGGTYTLDKPVSFGPADSGTAEHSVTYAAYRDEKPIISGAVPIKGRWDHGQPLEDHPAWSVQLPKGTWFQELFVNGIRQPRARAPAKGFFKARDMGGSRVEFGFDPGLIHVHGGNGRRIVAVVRTYEWHEQQLPVASLDAEKGRVVLAHPASYPIVPGGGGSAGQFALENFDELIAQPGHWSLDADGVLCYRPSDGVDPNAADIRGASTRVLFDVCGDTVKQGRVENLHFRGLTFTQTGRIERTEWGDYEGQAVRFQGGVRNCSVRGCTFLDLGGGGVTLWRDCRNVTVDANEFDRIGGTAVVIFDYLGQGPARSGANRITNNRIARGGAVSRYCSGIDIGMSESNLVAHNLIEDMPYIGVRLSGARPDHWQPKHEPSIGPPFTADKIKPFVRSRGNRVEFNHIRRVMQDLADGGGIYFWGTMGDRPNLVTNNLIEDVGLPGKLAAGIYMDDYCDDVQIRDNVVVRANRGLHLHGAPRITVENNVFAYCSMLDCSIQPEKYNAPPMNSAVRRNIFYMGAGSMGHSWTDWTLEPIGEMNFNCWWSPARKGMKLGFGQGFDKDGIVADPQFVDPAKPQAGLKPGSGALKLGFKQIDVSKVGPQETMD